MCGIAGEIHINDTYPSQSNVETMLRYLEPRGPDGQGAYAQDNIAFGHRRLKIIDLSDHSAQPMIDSDLGLIIAFNGCIYNYRELRKDLQKMGYNFFSSGDTEVIVKAYHAWGEDCVNKFHGMFAFAIWERDSKKVFMARDRFGIKPFYYQKNNTHFRFASFMPALLKMPDVDLTFDPSALHQFLSFRSIVGEHTLFNGIKKLPPASTMTLYPNGEIEQKTYWKMPYSNDAANENISEEEWIDRVEDAMRTAVKRRLVSDVPVGVLLSGGVDSSLIVGLLSELGQKNINTFSIGFETVADQEGNEFQYSDLIAKHYQTEHHKIYADYDMLKNNLSDCVRAMSEPMISHDVIGFYLLSQEVSKHIKVVQSGQGADEIFGGYHWFPPMMEISPEEAPAAYAKAYFNMNHNDYRNVVHDDYSRSDYALDYIRKYYDGSTAHNAIDKTLDIETSLMMVDDPVKRVDNMTMAAGLEARVPFLDHELAELAAQIPAKYKIAQGGKHVLKEMSRRIIPHEVIDRPKGYFPVPGLRTMEGDYLNLAKEIFSQQAAKDRGLFKQSYVDELLQNPADHVFKFGSKLWHITVLEYWLQEHGVG